MKPLAQQDNETATTWRVLQSHGVTAETPLVLDLFWYSPEAASANALAQELRAGPVHSIDVKRVRDEWSITAKTPPKAFSLDDMKNLVHEMNALGDRHGSKFDGWGAAIPAPAGAQKKKPWWRFW